MKNTKQKTSGKVQKTAYAIISLEELKEIVRREEQLAKAMKYEDIGAKTHLFRFEMVKGFDLKDLGVQLRLKEVQK